MYGEHCDDILPSLFLRGSASCKIGVLFYFSVNGRGHLLGNAWIDLSYPSSTCDCLQVLFS